MKDCDCGRPGYKTIGSGIVCKRCLKAEQLNEVIASQVIVGFKQKQPPGNPNFYSTPKEEDYTRPIAGGSLKYLCT